MREICTSGSVGGLGRQLPGSTRHDLRHTFNTYMRKAGVAESVIMQITGHATREMFDRYNTVDEDDARVAITQLQGCLLASGPQEATRG